MKDLQQYIKELYHPRYKSLQKRISSIIDDLKNKKDIKLASLNLSEIKTLSSSILEIETKKLHDELESLLAKKEQIERQIEKKSLQLQEVKYSVFNSIESTLSEDDIQTIQKLHQVKLQSVDLYDLLSETVESAIITALERSQDNDLDEMINEVIKELTYETIKEGTLNTIRVRKILSTILQSAIDIAEATPNTSYIILSSTLKGMRGGLLQSIDRFKQRLAYMPLEAKHILIEDYDTIMEDLNQTDILFSQVILTQANECSTQIRKELLEINKSMRFDLEELLHISKETAQVMKDRFSSLAKGTLKKADTAMKSEVAIEAKKMGKQAFRLAATAVGGALKSAKNVLDSKR